MTGNSELPEALRDANRVDGLEGVGGERERAGVHMDTMICFASIASRSSGPSVSRKIRTQQATKSRDRPHPHPAVQKTSVFRFCAHQFNNFF